MERSCEPPCTNRRGTAVTSPCHFPAGAHFLASTACWSCDLLMLERPSMLSFLASL